MILEVLRGSALGLSLAAPPGPVNALAADATFRRGPLSGSLVALGATTADFVFFLLAWGGAIALVAAHPVLLAFMSLVGAGVLLFFAHGAWRSARAPPEVRRMRPATFATGFVAAATSPFNFAWWLTTGTSLIASVGVAIVIGMFTGIVLWAFVMPWGLWKAGQRVRSLQVWIAYVSAAVLAAFAAWSAVRGWQVLSTAVF